MIENITENELSKLWLDMSFTQDYITNKLVYRKLLDNYRILKNYKNAWEELKNDNTELIEYGNRAVKEPKRYKNRKMYLLEQKYNLGSDKDA